MKLGLCDWFDDRYPKFQWIEQAAQKLGWETVRIHQAGSLAKQDKDLDLILFFQRPPVDWEILIQARKARGISRSVWALWVFDYLDNRLPLLHTVPWAAYDLVLCKQPEVVPPGVNSRYLDQAAPDHWEPCPDYHVRRFDVLMAGHYSDERAKLVDWCFQNRLKTAVAGPGWNRTKVTTFDFADPATMMNRTALVSSLAPTIQQLGVVTGDHNMWSMFTEATFALGDNYSNETRGYWSDRMWLAIAAGAVYIGPHIPGMPRVLSDGQLDFPEVIIGDNERTPNWRNKDWIAKQRKRQRALLATNRYSDRLKQIADYVSEL